MIGGDTVYFMQGMGMRHLDLETWETRPATSGEHRDAMIVADALENVHLADGVFFYMERQGIPPVMVMLENLAGGLRYSSKAEQFGYQQDCELFAIQSRQFHTLLAARGIENLIYTGFATNMCILNSPGGIADMAQMGYRIFIMREGTLAVEYPDTIADRTMTWTALRYIEMVHGHSIRFDDWMANCERLAREGAGA